jgi:hypothetical protein
VGPFVGRLIAESKSLRISKRVLPQAVREASKPAGLRETLGLGDEKELGGVSWSRHAVITALRPRLGVDAVQKYADHSGVKVTEQFYDLDTQALDLKSQAVEEARKIFKLGEATAKRSSTPAKSKRSSAVSGANLTPADPRSRPISAGSPRNARKTRASRGSA